MRDEEGDRFSHWHWTPCSPASTPFPPDWSPSASHPLLPSLISSLTMKFLSDFYGLVELGGSHDLLGSYFLNSPSLSLLVFMNIFIWIEIRKNKIGFPVFSLPPSWPPRPHRDKALPWTHSVLFSVYLGDYQGKG